LADVGGSQTELIGRAYDWINGRGPEATITYNGSWFDIEFLEDRMDALSANPRPTLDSRHVDIFLPRKAAADRANRKWPSLEECLRESGLSAHETTWRGRPLTNTRFGEELAPEYLSIVEASGDLGEFESVIYEYTASDVEANIALYETDLGREYLPRYDY